MADFIRSQPVVGTMAEEVSQATGRTANLFNFYIDEDLLIQTVLMLVSGNPHFSYAKTLRHDIGFSESLKRVASPSTLSRWIAEVGSACGEGKEFPGIMTRKDKNNWDLISHPFFDRLNEVLTLNAIGETRRGHEALCRALGAKTRQAVMVDIDNTFIATDGNQQGSAYCGKNRANGFFPLMVFIDGIPAHIQLAAGATDGRQLAGHVLPTVLETMRRELPEAEILVRADAGFNSNELFKICDRYSAGMLVGFSQNRRLTARALEQMNRQLLEDTGNSDLVRIIDQHLVDLIISRDRDGLFFQQEYEPGENRVRRLCGRVKDYRAKTWDKPRSVFYRVNYSEEYHEVDFRFIQTNMTDGEMLRWIRRDARLHKVKTEPENCLDDYETARLAIGMYDDLYCQRAVCELDIREFKTLAGDTSLCHRQWFSNFFRLILIALGQQCLLKLKALAFGSKAKSFGTMLRELLRIPALVRIRRRTLTMAVYEGEPFAEELRKLFRACG